jgi:hypothetical protein
MVGKRGMEAGLIEIGFIREEVVILNGHHKTRY